MSSPSWASRRRCRCTWPSSTTRSSNGAGSTRTSSSRGSSGTKEVSCGSPQPAPPPLRLGFLFGWVRVNAHLVHAFDPQLAQKDVKGGYQGYGQKHTHETEERAHSEQRKHQGHRVKGDCSAHHDRLYQVSFDRLDTQ